VINRNGAKSSDAAGGPSPFQDRRGADRRPNILFFFPDQHRGDWIESNPDLPVRMPNLATLAQQGVYFTNAVCPSPLCAPSRGALASGKEYDRCGVASNQVNYPLDQITFYTLLRDSGYHVMGCGKFDLHKPDLDWGLGGKRLLKEWGFSDGVDNEGKWDAIRSGARTPKGPYMAYLQSRGLREIHVADFEKRRDKAATFATPLPEEAYCDNWLAENGLALLRQVPQGRPWFLQINFTGPHAPWDVTRRMEASCRTLTGLPQPNGGSQFDAETYTRIRQNYSAMVENIDRWVGIYLEELRARGELERTLIVYSSDHGEMLGDHGCWGKSLLYQPSVGVPLVIAGPGIRRGYRFEGPTTTLDLTATYLDYAHLPIPQDMKSRSLRSVLEGKADTHRELVHSGLGSWRLVYDGRYKLVHGFQRDRNISSGAPALLFDLREDPGENVNLAEELPDVVARLAARLPS